MRFSHFQGAVAASVLLAAVPMCGLAAAKPVAAPPTTPAGPTMTPPGSDTAVPLMAGPPAPGTMNSVTLPDTTAPGINLPAGNLAMGMGMGMPGADNGADLSSILSGASGIPISTTLGQLTSTWRRITITGNVNIGDGTQIMTELLGSAGLGNYYTKGQTEVVDNVTYLVAYQTEPQFLNVTNLMTMIQKVMSGGQTPVPQTLNASTPLSLSLLNLQTIGSLTDIHSFDLSKEIADSHAAVAAYNALVKSFGGGAASSFMPTPHAKKAHPA